MRPLILLFALAVAASAASLRCFVREYEWQDDAGLGWATEIDTIVERPELLELASLQFRPVKPGTSQCEHHQRFNDVEFGWAVQNGGTVPFASYPTHCEDRVELSFGISTMGSERWGHEARHVTGGQLFAPQGGRVDMQTGTTNVREHSTRWRRLTARWATGSRREVAVPVMVHVCALEHDNQVLDVSKEWREIDTPRILPLADCVREFGGHCGVNVGWAASESVELEAHTGVNRVHPKSLENGWHLPSTYESGVHKPTSLKPHFHFGWACDLGLRDVEAKWHLDGYTLHIDHYAARCNDPLADSQPGRTFVWSTNDEDRMEKYKVHGDHVDIRPAQHHPNEKPKTEVFTQKQADKAWKKAGVSEPVVADQVAHAHGRRQSTETVCGCGYGCCDDCNNNNWWVGLVLLAVFLLVPVGILFFVLFGGWGCDDWHPYDEPGSHAGTRYYADEDEYRRIHGQDPPVHTHNATGHRHHHHHHYAYA